MNIKLYQCHKWDLITATALSTVSHSIPPAVGIGISRSKSMERIHSKGRVIGRTHSRGGEAKGKLRGIRVGGTCTVTVPRPDVIVEPGRTVFPVGW